MQKKINYVVQDYLPKHEAISREVYLLRNSFNSIVVDTLSVKNNADVNFNYKRNPLLIFKINKILKDSIHVYTSFGDRFHLCLINKKIILTGANDEQMKKFGLDKAPYEVFTLKHNPEKTDRLYYVKMLEHFGLTEQDVVYFEHNPEAVKSAQSVGITTHFFDYDKKDLNALKEFLDKNL